MSSFPGWINQGGAGGIPVYPSGGLPAPTAGLVVKLSDYSKGLIYGNGTSWTPITGLDTFNIEDFGGKGDAGVTDNLAPWNAIMAVIANATSGYGVQSGINGSVIRFSEGVFNFSDTPILSVAGCTVEGCGGAYSGARTLLTVPVGKRGFVVGDANQDGGSGANAYLKNLGLSGNGYLVGGTQSNINVNGWQANHAYAVGAYIQPSFPVNNGSKWGGYLWRCAISGTSAGSEPAWPIANTLSTYTESNPTQVDNTVTWQAVQAHGLVVHGAVHCENVTVSAFAGDGFHVYGDTTNSNTDLSTFINCNASSNYGSGFWTAGNDSAPSVYMMCNSLGNFGYGFYDYSLEGNVYINCHTRTNGSEAWLPTNSPTLNTFMSPTVPNDYLYMVTTAGGATGSTEPIWPTSVGSTITNGAVVFTCERHYSGGPYYIRNSSLITCYSEGGQQPTVLATTSAYSQGGSHGAGFLADPTATYGFTNQSRFNWSSFSTISNNGDGHPIQSWMGSRNSAKLGWSVAKTTAGSAISGTDLDLAFSTGNTTANGWRQQTNSGANVAFVVTDGTESGTTAGQTQFPGGWWLSGPQSPGGGAFFGVGSHTTAPSGGQLGDIVIATQGQQGIGTWHNIGSSADDGAVPRWCIGTEAGAFHPIDISSTSVGSPYVVTRGDHNAVFHNVGASVKSAVKLRYADEFPYARQKFIVAANAGIRIISQHGSKITWGPLDSGDAGYLESTEAGAAIELESTGGIYHVVSHEGNWNLNGVAAYQPLTELILATASVDSSLTTKQNLYTVPAGKTCIITKAISRSLSGSSSLAAAGFGFDAGAANVLPAAALGASGTYIMQTPTGVQASAPVAGNAGDVFGVKMTVTDTITYTVDVFGYLF